MTSLCKQSLVNHNFLKSIEVVYCIRSQLPLNCSDNVSPSFALLFFFVRRGLVHPAPHAVAIQWTLLFVAYSCAPAARSALLLLRLYLPHVQFKLAPFALREATVGFFVQSSQLVPVSKVRQVNRAQAHGKQRSRYRNCHHFRSRVSRCHGSEARIVQP